MARSNHTLILEGFTGRIDGFVIRQCANGVVLARRPRKPSTSTPAQAAARSRFAEAVKYAKQVLANPETKRMYEQRTRPGQTAYHLALAEHYSGRKAS